MRISFYPISILLIIAIHANCQDQDLIETYYYGDNWKITSKEQASFYRTAEFDMKNLCFNGEIRDFDIENTPVMTGNYSLGKRHKAFTFFNIGFIDTLKAEFNYGVRYGEWYEYSNNMSVYKACLYSEGLEKIIEYRSSNTSYSVQNGNGYVFEHRSFGNENKPYSIEGQVEDSLRSGKWIVKNSKGRTTITLLYDNGVLKKSKPNANNNEYDLEFFLEEFYLIEIPQSLQLTESLDITSGVKIPSNRILKTVFEHTNDTRGIKEKSNQILGYTGIEEFLDAKIIFNSTELSDYPEDDTVIISFVHNIDFAIDDIRLIKTSYSEALNKELLNILSSIEKIVLEDNLTKPVRIKYIYELKIPSGESPSFRY